MHFRPLRMPAVFMALMVLTLSLTPERARAQEHVVPLTELQQDARTAAEARTKDLADLDRVLSLPAAQDALRKSHLDQQTVRKAVSLLSDEEVARLAATARNVEKDVEGGLIIGLLALIGLIVVIIIVVAVVA